VALPLTLAFGVSQGSGFVGGPIFRALFIGGTAGHDGSGNRRMGVGTGIIRG
jgi:hypothetical protein